MPSTKCIEALFENRSEAEIVMKWKCRVHRGIPQNEMKWSELRD